MGAKAAMLVGKMEHESPMWFQPKESNPTFDPDGTRIYKA
eukprot:gene5723-51373_t